MTMPQFLCELIDGEVVRERFLREGEDETEVREQLEMFQWPEGHWFIRPTNDDE
jgi:hypothetical protein